MWVLKRPEHHFLEVIHVDSIDEENVGRFAGNLFAVIDNHLTARETPTQLNGGKVQRLLKDDPRVQGGSNSELIAHSVDITITR